MIKPRTVKKLALVQSDGLGLTTFANTIVDDDFFAECSIPAEGPEAQRHRARLLLVGGRHGTTIQPKDAERIGLDLHQLLAFSVAFDSQEWRDVVETIEDGQDGVAEPLDKLANSAADLFETYWNNYGGQTCRAA